MGDTLNLDDILIALEAVDQRRTYERWRYYEPAPKQMEFLDATREHSDVALIAANGAGKTETAAFAVSRWMTGVYPPWWNGRRFDGPVRVWAAGTSAKAVTEAAQTKLLGPPGVADLLGTGLIPKEAIIGEPRKARGYPDAIDSFQVRHVSGGVSRLVTKTYEQDRKDWQGADIDILWEDEEPKPELHSEGQARLRGRGLTILTFTPVEGMTEVVLDYLERPNPDRAVVNMGINDAQWYTPEQRERMIRQYPARERQARAFGIPTLGAGKVFKTPLSDILEPSIPLHKVPADWFKLWGIDFGGGSMDAHPFAAVLLGWDKENPPADPFAPPDGPVGTIHVLAEVRMTDAIILQHCDAMRRIAPGVPVAWPHDGHQAERSSGKSMAELYKRHGLLMLETHTTDVKGGISTYGGINDLDTYMQARQFKVGQHLTMWQQEYELYHYDQKGLLVKNRDDLMSATRIAHVMRRRARMGSLGAPARRERAPRLPINPWTGREEAVI